MATTSLDLTIPSAHEDSRGRSIASFLTASLLQIGVLAILVVAPLLEVVPPPPPRPTRPVVILEVTPPSPVQEPVVRPRRVRRTARPPDASRFEWVAPRTIPDSIPDGFDWVGREAGIWDGLVECESCAPVLGGPAEEGGTGAPEPVRPGGQIQPPKKIRHVDPVYPDLAREAGIEGVVILEAIIDPSGRVQNLEVLRSVPFLDDAAIAAVEQWEYEPTLLNGIPVPVVVTVTVRFVAERRR